MKMKWWKFLLLGSAVSMVAVAQERPSGNQDPFSEEAPQCCPVLKSVSKEANIKVSYSIKLEYFSLELEKSAKILRQGLTDTEAYHYLVSNGKIEELTMLRVSKEAASSKSILEHIYPTEYDPSIQESDKVSTETLGNTAKFSPTSFETRNTGSEVRAQITQLDNGNYYLSSYSEFVKHSGNVEYGEGAAKASMPVFTTQYLKHESLINLAQPTILGSMSSHSLTKGDASKKRVWFAVATVKQL